MLGVVVASHLIFSYKGYFALKVIEHKPYDHKADVFSFGIVLWELLTGKVHIWPCSSFFFGIPYGFIVNVIVYYNNFYHCIFVLPASIRILDSVTSSSWGGPKGT